jgi:hypothetical protein
MQPKLFCGVLTILKAFYYFSIVSHILHLLVDPLNCPKAYFFQLFRIYPMVNLFLP